MNSTRGRASPDLRRFFHDLGQWLELRRTTQSKLDLHIAPRFNVFDYIRPDENRLSDVIADLLDPHGAHGQGSRFLRIFLQSLGVGSELDPDRAVAIREARTTSIDRPLRRVDILVEWRSFALAIENKPWADEQTNQVADYVDHMEQTYEDGYAFVYLTEDGRNPGSIAAELLERLKERDRVACLSYAEIRTWLDRCAANCEAQRVRSFVEQFREYTDMVLMS